MSRSTRPRLALCPSAHEVAWTPGGPYRSPMCRVAPVDLGQQSTVIRLPMVLGAAAPAHSVHIRSFPQRRRPNPTSPCHPCCARRAASKRHSQDFLGSLAQRPAAGRQQPHRFPFEFIREFTARRGRQTPSCSHRSSSKVFTISREGHFAIRHVAWLTPDDPRIRKWPNFYWRMTYYEIISFTIYYYKVK